MAKVIALVLAATLSASAQTYTVQTFAGGVAPDGLAASAASLGGIYGTAMDANGNVYLSLADYDMVARIDAATGMLTRVAGGAHGFGGDGGPALSARLNGPGALALDAAGNLYIADFQNARVRMVVNGYISTVAQCSAGGLAVDASGALYIADFYNHVVNKLAGGVVTRIAGNGTYGFDGDGSTATNAQLAGPMGLAIDAAGNVYFAEAYANRVRKVSGGIVTTVAGSTTAGFSGDGKAAIAATLRTPADVALDEANRIYIADYGNNRVRVVTPNGTISTFAGNGTAVFSGDGGQAVGAGLAAPRRVLVDSAGNLTIADGVRFRRVQQGIIATVAGGGIPAGENGPAASAQLASPAGLAVDAAGNVYIADAGTGRILEVSAGKLTRVAGTGTPGFGGDNGPATRAMLAAPSAAAVDGAGNVYVADTQNLRVRKIEGGTISTIAGGGSATSDNVAGTSAQLNGPEGVAVDAGGNVYIADVTRVRTLSGGVISTAAGNGSSGYQGDGGPATAAYLADASAVAVDAAGNLYLADSANNRVRMVAGGTISTVAGNGTFGFSSTTGAATSAMLGQPAGVAADTAGNLYITDQQRVLKLAKGKLTTIAGAVSPQGIAVDSAGNLYVAEPAAHRVRMLSPAGTACSVGLAVSFAPNFQVPAAGGSFTVNTITGPSCSWTVENMPDWIAVAGDVSGVGPASIGLAVAPNPDAPRSATMLIGGQTVSVTQAGKIAISGQVTTGGAGLAGVIVTLSGGPGGTTTTDSGGNYSFPGLDSAGSYTVSPSLAGYTFTPPTIVLSNSTSNPTGNFVAWQPPHVTGFAPVFASLLEPPPATLAPGEAVAVYGGNLCSDPAAAKPTLPDRLAACMAKVDGTNIRLYYASGAQINAVLPQALGVGSHQLVIERYTDTSYKQLAVQSAPLSFTVEQVSLAFVEAPQAGGATLVAQYLDGGLAGPGRPLHPGDTIILYLTGLGRTVDTFPEGAAPGKPSAAVQTVAITVEGMPAQVLYAGVQPQYPGLDQITVKLPVYSLGAGETAANLQIRASTGRTLSYFVSSY